MPSTTVHVAVERKTVAVKPAPMPPLPVPIKWPAVTRDDKTVLPFKTGIELTAIPRFVSGLPAKRSSERSLIAKVAALCSDIFDSRSIKVFKKIHLDAFCVEAPSPVLKTWGEVKAYYERANEVFDETGCMPHHEKISSGGGHIHVSGVPVHVAVNTLRDMQNKPWISWTFNEPDDDDTAITFTDDIECLSQKLISAATNINVDPSMFIDDDSLSEKGRTALCFFGNPAYVNKDWLPHETNNMACWTEHDTIEFRMFEAPANWSEQEAHLRFAYAYLAHIAERYKTEWVKTVVTKPDHLKAFTFNQCESAFRTLLTELRLPHAPYERMIKENLTLRFRKGQRV